ncbi:MAG: hybrid sensor histidine kinase/response regulator, partial [Solirubrobacteraceae bacterium]
AKYTDPYGKIRLETRRDCSGAVVAVADNGTGIAADLLPRIFDLFVQSDRTLDRSQDGLGVGLAIVKRLVVMHNGEITVQSPGAGRGSTFEIRLPLLVRPRAATVQETTFKGKPQRVLIADDNADAADSLAMLLAFNGHDTQVVHAANEVLARVEAFRPDAALLDIALPEMDGYELAKRLRAIPQLHGLRLIALTGYAQPEDRQRAASAGFDAHLVKPVDLAALERALAGVAHAR